MRLLPREHTSTLGMDQFNMLPMPVMNLFPETEYLASQMPIVQEEQQEQISGSQNETSYFVSQDVPHVPKTPAKKRSRPLPEVKKRSKVAKRTNLAVQMSIDVDDDLTTPQTPQPGALATSPFALGNLTEGDQTKTSRVCYLDGSDKQASASSVRKGTTYLCSNEWRQSLGLSNEVVKHENDQSKLFYHLGSGLYIDRCFNNRAYYSPKPEEEALRIGLWHVNSIQKHQRAGSRYSVTLDFDALHILKSSAGEIENALKLCDQECFLGEF